MIHLIRHRQTRAHGFLRLCGFVLMVCLGVEISTARGAGEDGPTVVSSWSGVINERVTDHYQGMVLPAEALKPPADVLESFSGDARKILESASHDDSAAGSTTADHFAWRVGVLRARTQQAIVLQMANVAISQRVPEAQAWRAAINLPRGVSANEGALLLQALSEGTGNAAEVARVLTREAITWQTTRARQLLDQAGRISRDPVVMPGRLQELLGEAITLADIPAALRAASGVAALPPKTATDTTPADPLSVQARQLAALPWDQVAASLPNLARAVTSELPNLLTPNERTRRERLLLKLVTLVPKEYAAGVREGVVVVPLEYREAVAFTAQARQILGELAPLWLTEGKTSAEPDKAPVLRLEALLGEADGLIARKSDRRTIEETLEQATEILEGPLGISLRRSGTTADIVDEVLLEVRVLLSRSLAAALAGDWDEAERSRLEAYTTFDPELEARLLPRDPQLAVDIERLFLDGIDEEGIKILLDRRAAPYEIEAGYSRLSKGLDKAGALLKADMSPTAAAINAGSIVLREGLEGLLVLVAILAGLRGEINARRRKLMWVGIAASGVATLITYLLSQTLLTSLRSYGEVIAAVTGMLAIVILLLITNWLFHQIYWKQWVTTLKAQASEGESTWQLVAAGFLLGYREGFETVLFLQSLLLEAGGKTVGTGVGVGLFILIALGFAALKLGLKLPYYNILLATAMLIGVVLVTFIGGTVRAAQTLGWIPVHKIFNASWPHWLGQWLGLYNSWETVIAQFAAAALVLGTWGWSRYRAKNRTPQATPAPAVR